MSAINNYPLGAPGSPGTPGAAGKTVLNGVVDPTTEGVDGDFYINTVTSFVFGPKASGSWPAGTSLVGADGTNGTNGTNGTGAPLVTGFWTPVTSGGGVDWSMSTTELGFAEWQAPADMTISSLGVKAKTSSGAPTIRLGMYAKGSGGRPDAAPLSTTTYMATSGTYAGVTGDLTTPVVVTAGTRYLLSVHVQGTGAATIDSGTESQNYLTSATIANIINTGAAGRCGFWCFNPGGSGTSSVDSPSSFANNWAFYSFIPAIYMKRSA